MRSAPMEYDLIPESGWYVFLTVDGDTVDVAGPFDDEIDAELAARRAEVSC